MLIAYWHMFSTGETYRDLGGDYYARRDPAGATKRLVSKLEALEALGHTVTLQPIPASTQQAFPIDPGFDARRREQITDVLEKMTMLGRTATLQDVGDVAALAASDRARTMTGATVNVSCGALID